MTEQTPQHPNLARKLLRFAARAIWLTLVTIAWSLAAVLVIIGIGAIFSIYVMGPFILYTFAFLAMLLMAWSAARLAIRRRRMLLVLNALSSATRLDLPLSKLLHDAAQGETGLMRTRLMAVHDRLDRGESLEDALLRAAPEIPRGTLRAIGAAERLGVLEHMLDTIIHHRAADDLIGPRGARFYWVYPAMIASIVSLMTIIVLPKFEAIFRDFNLTLPWPTKMLIVVADRLSFIWIILVILTLLPLGKAMANLFPLRRAKPPLTGALRDRLIWWTPLLGSYVRDRGMARLCDFLAITAELGRPLDESLREAASAQGNAVLRQRASVWATLVSQGHPMHEAARQAKLPELFAALLATVRGGQSFSQVLEFLWRHYEYRVDRTRAIIRALILPTMVITLGICVAFVGASLFMPMVALTNSLSGVAPTGGF
jgi:type IV pilus assembly protein PilC